MSILWWDGEPVGVSERVAGRAVDLLEDRRVRLLVDARTTGVSGAVVLGREDDYMVWFSPEGVLCECYAGAEHTFGPPRCSHAVAAMIAWGEYEHGA